MAAEVVLLRDGRRRFWGSFSVFIQPRSPRSNSSMTRRCFPLALVDFCVRGAVLGAGMGATVDNKKPSALSFNVKGERT